MRFVQRRLFNPIETFDVSKRHCSILYKSHQHHIIFQPWASNSRPWTPHVAFRIDTVDILRKNLGNVNKSYMIKPWIMLNTYVHYLENYEYKATREYLKVVRYQC